MELTCFRDLPLMTALRREQCIHNRRTRIARNSREAPQACTCFYFVGASQRAVTRANAIPRNWEAMKAITWFGAIPANVSVSDRANVTAGLAKLVEDVN